MDMRLLVGRNFARLRKEKGLTQEEVEVRSGFSQQYLSDLERGKRNPTVITLFQLAEALGVGHVELVQPDEEALAQAVGRKKAPAGVSGRGSGVGSQSPRRPVGRDQISE